MTDLVDALSRVAAAVFERAVAHLPQWIGAFALLVAGWIAARVLRAAARRGAVMIDTMLARRGSGIEPRVGESAAVLGTIVYWVVLLFFVTAATYALGLQTFTDWLARLLDHLPTLAAGLLIVAAGYVLSGMVADLVRATATALAPPQRATLARAAQIATLLVALLVGADQVGLKITWIAILAAVLLASLLGGVAAAVSLGARGYVANLIGAHYLRQALRPGQRVRVASHEGRVVEVTATSLVLESDDGRVMLPGRLYHDEAIVLVARDNDD
jgi:hypothetical protein